MIAKLGCALLASAIVILAQPGIDAAHAGAKIKGKQQTKQDQAATMTAIALAESGGNTRSKRKGRTLRRQP
jgi:hypothetical protein